MLRPTLLALLLLTAGCIAGAPYVPEPQEMSGDCGNGKATFFLVVLHNKDFYNTAEEVSKDRFHTVDRTGRMFGYIGVTKPGSGRVIAPASALHNVTAADVKAQLVTTGQWDPTRDYHVEEAWRASIPLREGAALCNVLIEEREPPSQAGEERVACADGGTRLIKVSTQGADWERTIGCLGDASKAEYESSARIEAAFWGAAGAARATIGLD